MSLASRVPSRTIALFFALALACSADWLTYNHDPQRTGYNPAETTLSPQNVANLQLLWQAQLDNAPVALSALTAPLVADNVATSAGPKTLVFVAGSSNTFFAVNAADGKVLWDHTFTTLAAPKEESFYLCPNTPNATPVIDKQHSIVYTIAADGRLYGLDLASGDVKFGPVAFLPAFAKAWSLNLRDGILYTTTSQGCGGDRSGIYSMRVSQPLQTISHELLVRHGYGGGLWLRGGTVLDPDGTIYVSSGDGAFNPAGGDYSNTYLAAPADLTGVRDSFLPPNWQDISKRDLDLPSGGLLEFSYRGKRLLAGGGKESVIYLLDPANLGGAAHQESLYSTPVLANEGRALEEKGMWGSPAAWSAPNGESWLYFTVWGPLASTAPHFPTTNGETPHGLIVAFQVVPSANGALTLRPAWTSPDIPSPTASQPPNTSPPTKNYWKNSKRKASSRNWCTGA